MEATKTSAQREQYLAVCRHTYDNIIFNYGSVENFFARKNAEIDAAKTKLQSYYDNPRKGKSRRAAIIAGLENDIFIMKNGLENTLRELDELNAATPTETPQISTETVEATNVSAEAKQGENEAGMPKYTIYNRDGYTWVVFERGIIRQCAKRSGVSCKCAEWDTIAQAYNGVHSSMGFGNYFFFDSEADAIRFAELVAEGDVCGYWKLYMANLKAEIEAKKQRIAEECAEFDEAQAYFAEIDAGRIAQSLTTPPTPPDEPTIHPADKTPTERTETAETVNVSAEEEKEAERAENKPTATEVVQMVKTELAKNKAMRTAWHLEFPDGTECNIRHKCTVVGCDFYEYTETRNGEEAFKDYKATERDITLYICQRLDLDVIQPPQSPETPQTVECATDAPKPRETARNPQNRGIGSKWTTRRDALRNTLRPVTYVPRECSTADYW